MESISRKHEIIMLCSHALQYYDDRLVNHGARVAYIASHIHAKLSNKEIDPQNLVLLSLFHDIGAYKTEEIDRMVQFETEEVDAHSIYGYLFLKHLSPLNRFAMAILYHHTAYRELDKVDSVIASYAQLIHLSDRIDIALVNGETVSSLETVLRKTNIFFPEYIDAFLEAVNENDFLSENWNEVVSDWLNDKIYNFDLGLEEANEYLEMVIYTIDFKSEVTVQHSVNTTTISQYLGSLLGLNDKELEKLYYAALVHDIGKIGIHSDILEFPGRLTPTQMEEMKDHVVYTRKILTGIFDDEIVEIACRHHEKLDGSGYPLGLKEKDLSLSDRVLAIADITSALIFSRSYKAGYSWKRTLAILGEMVENHLIDGKIVDLIVEHQMDIDDVIKDEIMLVFEKYRMIKQQFIQLAER